MLIERYRRILEQDPRETFAFRRLLDLYRAQDGGIDGWVALLRGRVEQDDAAFAPRMLLGHVLKAQGHLDEARAAYVRAAALRPEDAAPQVALARIERGANDLSAARGHYDAALRLTRQTVAREELLREVAEVAMEQSDFDAARGYFEQLAGGRGASVYLRTEYARALAGAAQWALAVSEYQRVVRALRGDNRVLPPVLLELSRAQLQTGEVESSIATLDRALRAAGRQAGIRAEIYEQMRAAYRQTDRLPELAARLRTEARGGFEASALLGQIEDELGNDEAALAAYRRALRSRPRDIDARRSVIQILMRSGRLEEVVAEYRTLIQRAPREPRFVIELAQHLMQTDSREEALRLVRDAGRRNPRDARLHDQLAQLYARWGEEELSNREIELLARIDPQDPAHVIALGSAQFSAGSREAALATWRRVLEVDSNRARGHATLAGILADHDVLPLAIEHFERAVALEPDDLSFVRGLASTLERNDQRSAALVQWRRVLSLAGEDRVARREARERIVAIWGREGSLTRRIAELETRFGEDPPDAEAGRFLAEAYRRLGPAHQTHAERVLARLVEVTPSDVESLLALERLRRHRGDLAGAIEVLSRLRDVDPHRASHYLQQMAQHALALYRDDEAVQYAAEAVEQNPDDASGHRRLGDLYRARQDGDRAVRSYRRALELNERLYPVYFELAELYLARGQTDLADRLYRQVLHITPDDDLVSRAARASIQINLGGGSLRRLEQVLLPMSLGHPERPIFRRMAVELYDAYAMPLVRRARQGGADAQEARDELHRLGSRAIKPLLEALVDPDPAQRHVALELLGHLGNPNAAAPLLAVAENTQLDLTERLRALAGAGAVAGPARTARFTAIARGPDPRFRRLATWGLAQVGGREGQRALARLSGSQDPAVRALALMGRAIGPEGGRLRGQLVELIERGGQDDLVFASAWALGRVGQPSDVAPLIQLMRERPGAGARVAADALGRIGGESAGRALASALFDPDADLRAAAARALRGRPPASGSPLLAPLVFDTTAAYVSHLVESEDRGPPIEDLRQRVDDLSQAASRALSGPPEQQLAALATLGGAQGRLSLGAMTEDLDRWPDAQADRAREALASLAQRLIPDLVSAVASENAAVRIGAVRILAQLPDSNPGSEVGSAIAAALLVPLPAVQRGALEALAHSGQPLPSGPLTEALIQTLRAHRDWSMRTRAAQVLSRSDEPAAHEALREALRSDRYAFVREAAARALGDSLGARSAEDDAALLRARDSDSEPRVREASNRALH